MTECELNIATTLSRTTSISYKTNAKKQISRAQSFLIKSTFLKNIQIIFTTNHKQDSMHGNNKQTSVHNSVIMEMYDLCFACELQFRIVYPGLGMPLPLVIVYLISHLKFT